MRSQFTGEFKVSREAKQGFGILGGGFGGSISHLLRSLSSLFVRFFQECREVLVKVFHLFALDHVVRKQEVFRVFVKCLDHSFGFREVFGFRVRQGLGRLFVGIFKDSREAKQGFVSLDGFGFGVSSGLGVEVDSGLGGSISRRFGVGSGLGDGVSRHLRSFRRPFVRFFQEC